MPRAVWNHSPPTVREARGVVRCDAGDVAVEYVVLLGTIAIPLLPVLVAFGVWIVTLFENLRNLALLPFP